MSPLPTRPVRRLQFSRTSAYWSRLVPSWLWWGPVGLENQPWSHCCSGCTTQMLVRACSVLPLAQRHQPLLSNEILSIIRSVESTKLCEVLVLSFSPGIISIDGHDIRDLNPYWLRSHIGTVSQVINFLFLYNISHNTHINWAETQHKY